MTEEEFEWLRFKFASGLQCAVVATNFEYYDAIKDFTQHYFKENNLKILEKYQYCLDED